MCDAQLDAVGVRYRVFPAGTRLFRAAPELKPYVSSRIACSGRECGDTGKVGTYFATYPFMGMAIATEVHSDLLMGEFVTTAPIIALEGKYALETLTEAQRDALRGATKLNHFDEYAMPVLSTIDPVLVESETPGMEPEEFYPNVLPRDFDVSSSAMWAGELFVADPHDLAAVRLLRAFAVPFRDVERIAAELEFRVASWGEAFHDTWLAKLAPVPVPVDADVDAGADAGVDDGVDDGAEDETKSLAWPPYIVASTSTT